MSNSFPDNDSERATAKASRIRSGAAARFERHRDETHEWVGPGEEAAAATLVTPGAGRYHPDTFECFIGGFFGDSYRVLWQDGKLVHVAYGPGYEELETVELAPSAADWEEFWAELDRIGVWSWELKYGEYRGDHSTVYELTIAHAGLELRCSGADAFPPHNWRLADSEEFISFCAAIRRLTGWMAFR